MGESALAVGRFRLSLHDHVLMGEEHPIQLSPLASQLLQILAREPGQLVERGQLVDELWRGDWLVGDPALTRVVSEIRSAIDDNPKNPTLIQTIPRRGYRLVPSGSEPSTPTAPSIGQPIGPPLWRTIMLSVLILTGCLTILGLVATAARHFR